MKLKDLIKLTLLLSIITISSFKAATLNITQTPTISFPNFGFEAKENDSSLHILSFEISSDSINGFTVTLETTNQGKLIREGTSNTSTRLGDFCYYAMYMKPSDPESGNLHAAPDLSNSDVGRLMDYHTLNPWSNGIAFSTIGYHFNNRNEYTENAPLNIVFPSQTSPNYTTQYVYELYISLPLNHHLFRGDYSDTIILTITDNNSAANTNNSTLPASSTAYFDLQLSNQKLSLKKKKNKTIIAQK